MQEGPFDLCWDIKASKSLRKYYNYFKKHASESVANNFVLAISEAVETLLEQPERYPRDKHLMHRRENLRSISVWSFKVVYEFTGSEIIVLFIYHDKQSPTRIRKDFEK